MRLRVVCFLAALACGSGGGATDPPPPPPPGGTGPLVDVWVTTANQSKLLSRETDVRFATGAGGAAVTVAAS